MMKIKVLISHEEYFHTQVTEFVNKYEIDREDIQGIFESYREKQLLFTIFFWGTKEMQEKIKELGKRH